MAGPSSSGDARAQSALIPVSGGCCHPWLVAASLQMVSAVTCPPVLCGTQPSVSSLSGGTRDVSGPPAQPGIVSQGRVTNSVTSATAFPSCCGHLFGSQLSTHPKFQIHSFALDLYIELKTYTSHSPPTSEVRRGGLGSCHGPRPLGRHGQRAARRPGATVTQARRGQPAPSQAAGTSGLLCSPSRWARVPGAGRSAGSVAC